MHKTVFLSGLAAGLVIAAIIIQMLPPACAASVDVGTRTHLIQCGDQQPSQAVTPHAHQHLTRTNRLAYSVIYAD